MQEDADLWPHVGTHAGEPVGVRAQTHTQRQ